MKRVAKLPRKIAAPACGSMIEQLTEAVGDEWMEWYRMTPAERWRMSGQLWEVYVAMGGSLDPEPDTQSPFNVLPS